jgi:aspartyl aminopeptidase
MKKRKRSIPKETFDNDRLANTERQFPSLDCLTPNELEGLTKRINNLVHFETNCKTPSLVKDYVISELTKGKFESVDINDNEFRKKKKYFFIDPWAGNSIIAVKEGKLPITEGLNLIACHSDSPCLRIKPRPVQLEWDPDLMHNFLGIRLSAVPHGGILYHHWVGQQVKIHGYHVNSKGEKRHIEFPGVVADTSAHIEQRQEETVKDAFPPNTSLEIVIGQSSIKEVLSRFEFDSLDQFGESKFLAVPTNEPLAIDEYTWRLICGYGHDDKLGVFSSLDALRKARDPKYASLLYITDNEEVGDVPPSGLQGSFFDLVLDFLIAKQEKNDKNEFKKREKNLILHKSSLIYADVNIAPYGHDQENLDMFNSPKIGYGVGISTDDAELSHPHFFSKLRALCQRGTNRGQNICFQNTGNIYHQDKIEVWWHDVKNSQSLINKFGQWATAVGVPVTSMHSFNEIMCPGDEYWASKLYRRFYESNTPIGHTNGRN